MIERVEVGGVNEFQECNTAQEVLAKVKREAGDDAAELTAALLGLNLDGSDCLLSVASAPFRRNLARLRARSADERILRHAVADPEVEITDQDIAAFRELMHQWEDLTDSIKARCAKPVQEMPRLAPDEVERRKMITDRRKLDGNGGRR